MAIELVVFDIAGTTVADNGNVNHAFRTAFAAEGLEISEEVVDKVMGYRKIEAIDIVVNHNMPYLQTNKWELITRIHENFTLSMVDFYSSADQLMPLPFAEEVFLRLSERDIKVALNTGFSRRITDAILEKLGWDINPYISKVVCSDEVPEGRPHPYMIRFLMETLQIAAATRVAKVGDTEVDILEGRNAGCGLVVSVTTGASTRDQLSEFRPDHIIDSLEELPALILQSRL